MDGASLFDAHFDPPHAGKMVHPELAVLDECIYEKGLIHILQNINYRSGPNITSRSAPFGPGFSFVLSLISITAAG